MFKTTDASLEIFNLLKSAATMTSIKNITYGEFTNDNMFNVPWVGVYRGPVKYTPWTMPDGWKVDSEYRIIIQEGGYDEGKNVELRLETIIYNVLTILAANSRLNNKVSQIKGIDVEYSYWKSDVDETETNFQRADIIITTETRTR